METGAAAARTSAESAHPIWLWPNLLSLDAPAVALLWQAVVARVCGVALSTPGMAVLFLATWVVYAADRVLDGQARPVAAEAARHRFAREHAREFVMGIGGAAGLAVWLAAAWVPARLLVGYACLAAAVAGYLWMVHLAPRWARRYWPKEAAVSIFFAAGIFLPEWSVGWWRSAPMLELFGVVAGLLFLNVWGIEKWEKRRADRWYGACVGAVTLAALANCMNPWMGRLWPVWLAIAGSAMLLGLLDHRAARLSRNGARVLADAALFTALLFLPLLGR